MSAFIADSFHLDHAPASASESLIDLVERWERLGVVARGLTAKRASCEAAMKAAGHGKHFAFRFSMYVTDQYCAASRIDFDRIFEQFPAKYRWSPEATERFRARLLKGLEDKLQAWNDAAAMTGFAAADEAESVALEELWDLEDRIGKPEPQSLSDVLAQARLLRGLNWNWKVKPDDQDWQVDIMTRISNGIERLCAQAEA